MVVWHSKFLEEADWVGGEFFDFTRFYHVIKKASHLVDIFTRFLKLVAGIVADENARRLTAGEPLDTPVCMPWITAEIE